MDDAGILLWVAIVGVSCLKGIGAVDAGRGDTAAALVDDDNRKESTDGPMIEVDNGGPRNGTAKAGGVLNLVIVRDDAISGREREDGSGSKAVGGGIAIGVVVRR